MWGIGYRTVAARAMSGRALKAAGLGAAIAAGSDLIGIGGGNSLGGDEGYEGGQSPSRITSGGLLAIAAAVAAAQAAADGRGEIAARALSRGLQSLAGFAPRGNPAGFIAGALLGYLASYLAYQLANRGDGFTPSFAGFTPVLNCAQHPPDARDPPGNLAFCDVLQVADKGLYEPYSNLELVFGFQTMWKYLPARWTTVTKYVGSGGATAAGPMPVDHATYSDEMIAAGAAVLSQAGINPWPEEGAEGDIVMRPPVAGTLPKPIGGALPAIPPNVDPEQQPIGRAAPNPNHMVLPRSLVVSRRDSGNPYRVAGYSWTAGPRPGEFRPPAAFPQPQIKVPSVTVDRDGNQSPGRVNPNVRPAARMHERKVKAPTQSAAQQAYMSMFGAMTEIGEFVDAIYQALPQKIQTDDYFANGKHELGRDDKLWSIYKNYKAINVDQMVKNIVFNNLQDAVIGKGSRDITAMSGGSPIGRTLGLF